VVARLECSLQPVDGEIGMRQEVDIRHVVTSLKGSAQHLYENVYCQRGQMENLIKLHKAQLASDRMSCHSATANQVRLALHTAAFCLMHCMRSAIPPTNPLARCEFATLRERLIKIGARVIEDITRIRVQLPTSCPDGALFRAVALGLMPSGP
jgi:Transposase DDE domain group 1